MKLWLMGPLSRSLGNDGQETAYLHELVEVESAVAVLVRLAKQVWEVRRKVGERGRDAPPAQRQPRNTVYFYLRHWYYLYLVEDCAHLVHAERRAHPGLGRLG